MAQVEKKINVQSGIKDRNHFKIAEISDITEILHQHCPFPSAWLCCAGSPWLATFYSAPLSPCFMFKGS